MDAAENITRLRRQRNMLGVAAVVITLTGIAISLPQALERRRQLKAANTELLQLQAELVAAQQQIVKVQADIRQVQAQILALSATK